MFRVVSISIHFDNVLLLFASSESVLFYYNTAQLLMFVTVRERRVETRLLRDLLKYAERNYKIFTALFC